MALGTGQDGIAWWIADRHGRILASGGHPYDFVMGRDGNLHPLPGGPQSEPFGRGVDACEDAARKLGLI